MAKRVGKGGPPCLTPERGRIDVSSCTPPCKMQNATAISGEGEGGVYTRTCPFHGYPLSPPNELRRGCAQYACARASYRASSPAFYGRVMLIRCEV